MRCVHEASLYEENSFITLTFNDENISADESLEKRPLQLFLKRIRKEYEPKKIRFFAAGEYGTNQDINSLDTIGRPHYHLILFNHDFNDKIVDRRTPANQIIYRSAQLEKLWPFGYSSIGEMSFDAAAYVARYCVKKINGEMAESHYQRINYKTGEITNIKPEFMLCSRMPGIGHDWFIKYKHDLDKGFITMNGHKIQYPKYYDHLYKKYDDEHHMFMRRKKYESVDPMDIENSNNRLRVREKIRIKKTKQLERNLT